MPACPPGPSYVTRIEPLNPKKNTSIPNLKASVCNTNNNFSTKDDINVNLLILFKHFSMLNSHPNKKQHTHTYLIYKSENLFSRKTEN